jgi:diguanylate cyclase (GGDEF)-like protein
LLFAIYGLTLFKEEKNSRLKRAWLCMALSGILAVVGDGFWFYYESVALRTTFVTPIDIFYWFQYAFLMFGVLSFPFTPVSKKERTIFTLDWLIVLITGLMATWYFYIAPVISKGETSPVALYEIAFMIFVLIVISTIVPLIQREIEDVYGWTPVLLSGGMILLIAADGFYSYFNLFEIEYPAPNLNILWNASQLALVSALALQFLYGNTKTLRQPALNSTKRLLKIGVPYIATLVGLCLLFLSVESSPANISRIRGMFFGTVALVAAVLMRQFVVLRENISLYEQMHSLAVVDSLTGVYNRHFINESLHAEIERAKRYNHSLAIMMVDVDYFKELNDTFGHLKGDAVLAQIASLLSSQLRSADLLGRFGGDEFLLILPSTDRCGVEVVAERMRNVIANSLFFGKTLSISVGIAEFREDSNADQLIDRADRELYKVKAQRSGKMLDEKVSN